MKVRLEMLFSLQIAKWGYRVFIPMCINGFFRLLHASVSVQMYKLIFE